MSALDQIPGLAGYVAAQNQAQQQTVGNINVATLLAQLQQRAQANQREQAYRQELAGATTPDQQEAVAVKYGGPEAVMKSLDRRAQIAATRDSQQAALQQRADQAAALLEQRTNYANAMLEFRRAQAKSADERAAADAAHRAQVLQFQQQNAATMAELKRMGLQMQGDRQAAALKDKEEKDIEKQINTAATRLKDVQPVMVAAHQLNDLLSQYSPDNVPGVGYLKNTDTGKVFLSKEGKDVSSSIKLVGNAILKAMSGTAVTAPEEVRQMAAQMADGRYDAKDFYIAWPKVAGWLNSQSSVATSGLTDSARQRLVERTGMNLDPVRPRFSVEYQGGKLNLKDSRAPASGSDIPAPPPGFKVVK